MSRVALAPGCAREYETILITKPEVDKTAVDGIIGRMSDAIGSHDGRMMQVEVWGRRRLAFSIHGQHRGVYLYVKYLGRGHTVTELERQLGLLDTALRHQTVMLRSNVPLQGLEVSEEDIKPDFDLGAFADEPIMTRERELGLDGALAERGGRHRRDDRGRGERPEPADRAADNGEAKGRAADDGEAKGRAVDDGEAKGAAAAPSGEPAAKTAEGADGGTSAAKAGSKDDEPAQGQGAAPSKQEG